MSRSSGRASSLYLTLSLVRAKTRCMSAEKTVRSNSPFSAALICSKLVPYYATNVRVSSAGEVMYDVTNVSTKISDNTYFMNSE